jgi:hypothetical protein
VQVTAGAASGTASIFSLAFPNDTVAGDLIVVGFDFNTNTFSSIPTPREHAHGGGKPVDRPR